MLFRSRGDIVHRIATAGDFQMSANGGGHPSLLRTLNAKAGEQSVRWPVFLPGGHSFLFAAGTSTGNWTNAQAALFRVDNGQRQNLVDGATQPRYATSDHLVYAQNGSLMAIRFNPEAGTVSGASAPVVEVVLQSVSTGASQYAVADNGTLAYIPGHMQGGHHLMVWEDRKGVEQPIPAPAHAYRNPRISPNGHTVEVVIEELGNQVWTYDLDHQTLTQIGRAHV